MAFKLGRERRDYKIPGKSKIFKKQLDGDTLAEANMDGSIYVDPSINLNSKFGRRVIKHEQKHLEQIEEGRAGYNDNVVMWEGKLYMRRKIDGEDVIDGPNGRWPEGHKNHPWEAEAIQAEKE
jgi:hypothetical protein|tara:strand:+ start:276 stop:644 length:369 start_codon:yes stop_codon:yes gene_type:complete